MPLFLFVDHQLAILADQRIAARHYDFLENYNPDEIDWDDPNWRKCWQGRELVFYGYETCIKNYTGWNRPDPRLIEANAKNYEYWRPLSIWEDILGDGFAYRNLPRDLTLAFFLHESGLIEREGTGRETVNYTTSTGIEIQGATFPKRIAITIETIEEREKLR